MSTKVKSVGSCIISRVIKNKIILQYHHIACIFKQFHKARVATSVLTHIDDLNGYKNISANDKRFIQSLIDEENGKRKVLPATQSYRPKVRVSPEAPPHIRKARLKSSNAESLNVLFTNADQLTTPKMAELRMRIQQENPMIVAICEVKPKKSEERHVYGIPVFFSPPSES